LIEDKTYKEDTQFLENLHEILSNIKDTFDGIYLTFIWESIDNSKKTNIQEADNNEVGLKLNYLYNTLKGQLRELIESVRPFFNIDQKTRYLANYLLKDIDIILYASADKYTRYRELLPKKYRSVIDGQYSALILIVRGLNTGFQIYNQTEVGKAHPLDYFNIPSSQFLDFKFKGENLDIAIKNFKKYIDSFLKEIMETWVVSLIR
jgi:hypothetical protein